MTWTEEKRQREIELQRNVGDFVNREVYYCVSSLVHELAQNEKYMDELMPVLSRSMWTHTFEYCCDNQHLDKDGDEINKNFFSFEDDEPRPKPWDELDEVDDLEEYAKPCPTCGEMVEPEEVKSNESDPDEAYEHWIVSDWLARKLKAKGEMVLDNFMGLTIWGRGCTGQSISMDYVIREIYLDCHPEERKAA